MRSVAWAVLGGALCTGCATWFAAPAAPAGPLHPDNPRGHWHLVAPGETLKGIAAEAGVPVEDLMELNGIKDSRRVEEGQYVFVLMPDEPVRDDGAVAPGSTPPAINPDVSPDRSGTIRKYSAPSVADDGRLRWPLEQPVLSSPYGVRGGKVHEGIDLSAATGTPVLAADNGEVIYAGSEVAGYGNMVVIQHAQGLLTVYAHNSLLLARTGDRVTRGQTVARVGQSGRASAPHLHFEVRQGDVPRDPMVYLPALRSK